MAMKKGVLIGEWELVRQLNTGGMGQVWQAKKVFSTGDSRVAAIKILRPSGVLDPRSRKGLLTEAGIQMQLQHDNIPKVLDVGVHEGLPYLVMDYISGRDLAQVMSKLRDLGIQMPHLVAAHVTREVGYALDYAHTFDIAGVCQNVIHRDIAPKNIMVSGKGGVYVLDFGVAEASSHKTSNNAVKGTLLYMAPEHALGFPTPKSDAWGLGTVLWEMLENRVFRSEVDPKDLRKAANEGWVSPLTRRGIPDVLRFLVEGLLRKDERDRLSILEVLEHLEQPEFPPQRTVLAGLMQRGFGKAVLRSGQTQHEFEISDELDRALAAAELAKKGLPTQEAPTSWSGEAFARAGAPHVVARSTLIVSKPPPAPDDSEDVTGQHVRPTAVDDPEATQGEPNGQDFEAQATQRLTPPSSRRAPKVITEVLDTPRAESDELRALGRPETTERVEPPRAEPVPATVEESESEPAPSEDHDPGRQDETGPMPVTMTAPDEAPMVAVGPRAAARRRGLPIALSVFGTLVLGFAMVFALWPLGDEVTDAEDEGAIAADHSSAGGAAQSPPKLEPTPTAVQEPAAMVPAPSSAPSTPAPGPGEGDDLPVEPEQPRPDESEDAPSETPSSATDAKPTPGPAERPEPTAAPETTEPEPEPEPAPSTEPTPSTEPARRPKPAKPTPVVKSTLNMALGFVDAIEVNIGGTKRTLRREGPDTATIVMRPGLKTVRWRKPDGEWHSAGQVRIVEGTDYKVYVGSKGPTFEPIGGKP